MTVRDIYDTMRERICLLDLEPGARLREEPLAEEFGVSRTPVRAALARLEHERLVHSSPGSGATVAIIDAKEIRDVWAVRMKIADLVADFVRLPAPPDTLAELDDIATATEAVRTSRDTRQLGVLYNRYHDAVLSVYTSRTLRRIHDQLFHLTARVWLQFLPELDLDDEIDIMLEEVQATREAMQGNSGQRLAEVRTTHMKLLLERFNAHAARPLG
nr:GntR family transcriptional regulator [Salsipaludibacter albus]